MFRFGINFANTLGMANMTTNQTTLTTSENMTEVANVILNVLVDYASKEYPSLPSEAQCAKLLAQFKTGAETPELAVMAEIAVLWLAYYMGGL